MCFSATASFGASIVLSAIGVVSIKKVQHHYQCMFAAIPLLFAIQQFSEGILWLTLPYPDLHYFQSVTTLFYLVFAQIRPYLRHICTLPPLKIDAILRHCLPHSLQIRLLTPTFLRVNASHRHR